MPGVTVAGVTVGSRALTGLRGVAALFVVFHHLYLREHLHVPLLNTFAMRGYLAVDMFFVLSGFVMALSYGSWFAGSWDLPTYLEFMKRRVTRLWPLHTAVVLAVLGMSALEGSWGFWPKMILANLLMVQGWGWSQVIVSPTWSVSTEMLAYALFPLLAAMALHGGRRAAWVSAALAVAALVACVWLAPDRGAGRRGVLDIYDNWSVLPMLRCLGGFTLGLLTFRALQTPWVAALARHPAAASGSALGVIMLLVGGAPDGLVYAGLPPLIASLFTGAGPLQALLARTGPYRMGVLSFALYLVHIPTLDGMQRLVGIDPVVFIPVFAVTAAALTIAVHLLIERPFQPWLRRFEGLRETRSVRPLA